MTTIYLKHPIELRTKDGDVVKTIDSVEVTPLKTGALLNALDEAGKREGSLLRALFKRSTRMSGDDVDRLHLEDFAVIMAEVESFLPASLRTGGMHSNSSQEHSDFPTDGTNGAEVN